MLFLMFTSGLHLDLHWCKELVACHAEYESDCCQEEAEPEHGACCEDTNIDYHLHDAAYVSSSSFKTSIPEFPVDFEIEIIESTTIEQESSYYLLDERPPPSEPLFMLYHSWKLDC